MSPRTSSSALSTIGLWEVGVAHAESGVGKVEQLLLEEACEDEVVIRDDVRRHAMEMINVVEEELHHMRSGEGMDQGHKVCELAKLLNDHHNAIGGSNHGSPSMKSIEMTC